MGKKKKSHKTSNHHLPTDKAVGPAITQSSAWQDNLDRTAIPKAKLKVSQKQLQNKTRLLQILEQGHTKLICTKGYDKKFASNLSQKNNKISREIQELTNQITEFETQIEQLNSNQALQNSGETPRGAAAAVVAFPPSQSSDANHQSEEPYYDTPADTTAPKSNKPPVASCSENSLYPQEAPNTHVVSNASSETFPNFNTNLMKL